MTVNVLLLIKVFDKEQYADAFIEKGELFCRELTDFKQFEGDQERGDIYEGVTDWYQPDQINLSVTFDGEDGEKTIQLEDLAGPVIMQNTGYDQLNLYCMYAVKIPAIVEDSKDIGSLLEELLVFEEEIFSLGEFAVVVYDVRSFIGKVRDVIESRGVGFWRGLIGYYDPEEFNGSFQGVESVFRKRNTYQHQNEYRFAFGPDGLRGPKTIHLGSLDGVAVKIPSREIQGLKLQLISQD